MAARILALLLAFACLFLPPASAPAAAQTVTVAKRISSLSFSWSIPAAMAAFRRGDYLWIVFDHMQMVDTVALGRELRPFGRDLIQLPHSKATVIRMTVPSDVNVYVRKEGFLWIVDLSKMEFPHNSEALPVFVQSNSVHQPYLFIPDSATANITSFIDPKIGDAVVVAPLVDERRNIPQAYSYPDLDLLATYQGVAVLPKAGDLAFSHGNNGISIRSETRGLNISPDLEMLKRREKFAQTDDDISSLAKELPFDLLRKPHREALKKLKADIAAAPKAEVSARRLDLARYYIGRGMGVEAIRELRLVENGKDPVVEKEKFHGLCGVAGFLARRYDRALEQFSYGRLPAVNAVVFWRAVIEAAMNPKPELNVVIQSFVYVMKDYPEIIGIRLAQAAIGAAREALDDMSMQNFIDIMKTSSFAPGLRTMTDYFSGEKLAVQSYPRSALNEYRKGFKSNDQKYSAFSRYRAALIERDLNAVPVEKTVEELERLRFAWGDREFKIDLLDHLAKLYEKKKDYSQALKSLQLASDLGTPEQSAVFARRMISAFEDVFVHNQADDTLPPLKIIALYHDFEHLAPLSAHYNDILFNIVDRLIAVDLVDRAATILNGQLRFNALDPAQRARAGARLALAYLFDGANAEALEVLDDTDAAGDHGGDGAIPAPVRDYRRIIRARALANMGDGDKALELLDGNPSRSAITLRTEIYWNAGRWGEAADEIKLLVEKPRKGEKISREQASLVLDWIAALKQAGRETAVVRIRNAFLPAFADAPEFAAFGVLTDRLDADEINMADIRRAIADAKAFTSFSKMYIDMVAKEELKALADVVRAR